MTARMIIVPLLAATVLAAGCASPDARYYGSGDRYYGNNDRYYGNYDRRYAPARSFEGYYGVIDAIDVAPVDSRNNALAGTVIGGVIGGVLGHQVGSGRGNDVATVAGAVGGAVVGHEIGRSGGGRDVYVIRVRFDDRSTMSFMQDSLDGLRVGDSVRVEQDRIRRY
ncbi:hypothetical protein BURK1_02071 [Burkholderiales bacterium]|nr:hypothetical protein BURK1_02071 [Burkholderiales bacterium]